MVLNALQDISRAFGIKKGHGQAHHFLQKIRDEREIDTYTDTQQYPSSDKISCSTSYDEHNLSRPRLRPRYCSLRDRKSSSGRKAIR